MKDHISVKTDAIQTARHGEHESTVLFDTGPTAAAWEQNVRRLKPDLSKIDTIVLSHWHRDHSGGMLKAVQMINDARRASGKGPVIVDLHPDRPDYRGIQMPPPYPTISLEADPTFEELSAAGATVNLAGTSHVIQHAAFGISGEIARLSNYENGLRRGMRFIKSDNRWIEDTLVGDERYLVCHLKGWSRLSASSQNANDYVDRGIVVFTGCGHAGVVNTCWDAIKALPGVQLHAVMGGFHLADAEDESVGKTVEDLKALKPSVLLPGHCSGWRVKQRLEQAMPGTLAPSTVGTRFTFV